MEFSRPVNPYADYTSVAEYHPGDHEYYEMRFSMEFHRCHINFNSTKKVCLYMLLVILLAGFDLAQERTITGKVTALDDGFALPGVNVVLKGTTKGTVTDARGMYSIQVPSTGGTLVFSFIGYTTKEIRVGKQNVVNVQLASDIQVLQEEGITGYRSNGQARRQAGKYVWNMHCKKAFQSFF